MDTGSLIEALVFFIRTAVTLVLLFFGITFLMALLLEYISPATIRRILMKGPRGRGNIVGALFGSLTPLCACGSIPVFVGLLNAGVPFGITISFLLASPLINPVIVGLMAALFGWQIAAIYAAICFVLAVLVGAAWEKLGFAQHVKNVMVVGGEEVVNKDLSFRIRIGHALRQSWSQLCRLWPHLLGGVAIASLVRGFMPADWIAGVAGGQNPFAIPVAAVIGGPLYIRGVKAIPILSSLLEKGMGLGAAMALLVGASGTSIPSISIMSGIFKPRLLAIFVVTILLIAIVAGYIFWIYTLAYSL